jgi:hypothetical protein
VTVRGIRNNNPGNIREAPGDRTQWVGERATDDDKAFEEFQTPEHGIRALAITLRNYQRKYGLRTVRGIIDRWAPPVENNTKAYVSAVADHLMTHPDERIDVEDPRIMTGLVEAIIKHENGVQPYAAATIRKGLALAGIGPVCTTPATPPVYGLGNFRKEIPVNAAKPAIRSLAIVGPVLSGLVLLVNQLYFKADVILPSDVTAVIDWISTGIAIATAIIGRYRATAQITTLFRRATPALMLASMLALTACAGQNPAKLIDTPEEQITAAKALYTVAAEGIVAAYDDGQISDYVLVHRIAPVRDTTKDAIAEADRLSALKHPDLAEYAQTAYRLAVSFDALWKEYH